MRREAVWAAVAVLTAVTLHAQPIIEHSGLDCMRPGEFAVVLSGIDPEDDVQTAKVYFRSRLYRDFYYVEMTYQDGEFVGILPQPSPETPGVVYYLEALDSAFNTGRSREYVADIEGRCRQEPAAAYFPGGDAGITVGATAGGGPALPPGFAAAGIVGTITATGVVSGVGGGLGAGTAVAVGAAAAAGAGAGVAVLSADDGGSATSSVIAGGQTTSVATTSTIVAGQTSTTVPTPTPGPGSTTTTTTTTTSSPPSTTTTPFPALDASCFDVAVTGECSVRVDASCVAGPVDQYEWVLDLLSRWNKVEFLDGPSSLTHTWSGADGCDADGETLRFRLKVRRGDITSTAHKNLFVLGSSGLKATSGGEILVRVRSQIDSPAPAAGRVVIDGKPLRVIESGSPVEIRAAVERGENSIVGVVTTTSDGPGTWRFAIDPIVPGSLRIVSGNVLGREPSAVVFRLSGQPGERVELVFVPRE